MSSIQRLPTPNKAEKRRRGRSREGVPERRVITVDHQVSLSDLIASWNVSTLKLSCTASKPLKRKKDFSDIVDELYPHLSSTARNTLRLVKEEEINYELIEELIMKISKEYEEGGILVFLPGLMEITNLYEQLLANRYDTYLCHRNRRSSNDPCVGSCGTRRII